MSQLRPTDPGGSAQAQQPSLLRGMRHWLALPVVASFIAGGCAGAVSRTVVSPFERMKIIFQVQDPRHAEYQGLTATLRKMWKEEGWRGFMRGNGINCVRIVPYSAVQFCTYTVLKNAITDHGRHEMGVDARLCAGALAGIASVCATYPMDLVRTRLSIQTASIGSLQKENLAKPPGMWQTMRHIYRTEGGFRALWRGLVPTTLGVAPYVGINFACYEWIRDKLTPAGSRLSTWSTLAAGALSGAVAQTFTYPFDVLRRRFQVESMARVGPKYAGGIVGTIKGMLRTEGLAGFYRGLGANLLKVAPSMASSFLTFEWVKRALMNPH